MKPLAPPALRLLPALDEPDTPDPTTRREVSLMPDPNAAIPPMYPGRMRRAAEPTVTSGNPEPRSDTGPLAALSSGEAALWAAIREPGEAVRWLLGLNLGGEAS